MKNPTSQFQQIPNSFLRNTGQLSSPALRVMLALITYKPCHPDYETIIANTGLSRPSVSSAIKELKTAGYLTYKKGNSYRKQANEYTLTWTPNVKLNSLTQPQSSSSFSELNLSSEVEYIKSQRVQVKSVNSNNSNIIYNNVLELNSLTQGKEESHSLSDLNGPNVTDSNNSNSSNQDNSDIPESINKALVFTNSSSFVKSFTRNLQLHLKSKTKDSITKTLNPVIQNITNSNKTELSLHDVISETLPDEVYCAFKELYKLWPSDEKLTRVSDSIYCFQLKYGTYKKLVECLLAKGMLSGDFSKFSLFKEVQH